MTNVYTHEEVTYLNYILSTHQFPKIPFPLDLVFVCVCVCVCVGAQRSPYDHPSLGGCVIYKRGTGTIFCYSACVTQPKLLTYLNVWMPILQSSVEMAQFVF